MRRLLSMVMVVGLVACHRQPEVQPSPYRDIGDYAYRMSVGNVVVEGEFSIEADTVLLEADKHSCRRLDTSLRDAPYTHSFSCGGGPTFFTVLVNSKQPTLSRWGSTKAANRTETICTRTKITEDRQEVCVATRKTIVPVAEPITGRMEVTRIASTDKP
jgi:hypothetical protein